MAYTDKFIQLPVIDFHSTEEVKNDDGTTSVSGACSIYYSYINPFDITRFESHSYSSNITTLYTKHFGPIAIDMGCDEFMDMVDAHVAKS